MHPDEEEEFLDLALDKLEQGVPLDRASVRALIRRVEAAAKTQTPRPTIPRRLENNSASLLRKGPTKPITQRIPQS